ncbi:periplasmic phosphate binding protein [Leptolyngbya sp. NIES-3755]|nr:periplasmic phosphate binding protein [Leptolyngbya sp. NIES-3755]
MSPPEAGATFPALLYERYISEFKKKEPSINVNYQAIGSGGGIRQVIAGVVDFGGSDAAMTDEDMAKVSRGIILVPTAGGAVTPVYNLPGVNNLKLSREVLPEIFAGRITKWNDPKIAKDNSGVNLPNSDIKSVVRADGSGTTFIFTNHLSAVSPYFKGRVGVGTAPKWTTNPLRGRGNPGVAALVQKTPGSIGYVEYSFAKKNNLSVAAVQNQKGEFLTPSIDNTNKALSTVNFPPNFRVFEGNPADGYPITGLTWMMVYKQYDSPQKSEAMKKWIEYVLTEGQNLNGSLDFTRIPEPVAQRALQQVRAEVKP